MSMRTRVLLMTIGALALAAAFWPDAVPAAGPRMPSPVAVGPHPHVIVVSFDGLRPDAIEAAHAARLLELIDQGSWTPRARTIDPSVTLPSHTSMFTGMPPSVHKVDWNSYQPAKGYPAVPTIMAIATDAGLTSAMIAGKQKFAHLAPPGSMLHYEMPGFTPRKVFETAAKYYTRVHPDLLVVHCAEPDGTGHAKGWMSPDYLKAVQDADAQFGKFLDMIDAPHHSGDMVFIISADHGGHDKTHGSRRDVDMQIPWIAWGAGIKAHTVLQGPVSTMDTAATALSILGLPIPATMTGRPVIECFAARAALPASAAAPAAAAHQ